VHLAEEAILIGGDRFGHGEIAVEVRPGNTASRDGRTLYEHFATVCTIENGKIVAIETTSPMWAV
jgi:ketosteroid isomerase-like protein